MSRYVVLPLVPFVVGSVIAVAVLLINWLHERLDLKDMELREARRLNSRDFAMLSARPPSGCKDRRTAS
jgi:hypothetical protein